MFETLKPDCTGGWSGGAKVLGKLSVPGHPIIWNRVGQGPTALAVGAGGGCLDIFTLIYPFSSLSPSLWETARYRLKYCLKGPLNPKEPTNQPIVPRWVTGCLTSWSTRLTLQQLFLSNWSRLVPCHLVGWLFWGLMAL